MGLKTSATTFFHDPAGARAAASAFLSGPAGGDASLPPPAGASAGHHDESDGPAHRYRTIWLSDIHLGTSGCQAPYLLDFLRHNDSEYLYLVGDIIDGWQLRKGWYWPQAHNDVVQKILRKARKGTQVIYIPGNHDEAARQFCDLAFGDIQVRGEAFHTTLGASASGSSTATCSTA